MEPPAPAVDHCPNCQAAWSESTPGGLCPCCLIRLALSPGEGNIPVEYPAGVPGRTESPEDRSPLQAADVTLPAEPGIDLHAEIARGAMGSIYRGYDARLGREVAVKVLRERYRDHPEVQRRFVDEARIAARLQHPGIVPVYELGHLRGGSPYIAMKLVDGETLAARLEKRSGLLHDVSTFISVFQQACQALAYAHARNVIHRDLKPANIMVGRFGEVQVMDWGLAKVLDGATGDAGAELPASPEVESRSGESRIGSVVGTPAYMAPEQADGAGRPVDQRADVFGLGSILCEILTGQPAFYGESSEDSHRQAALADTRQALDRLAACRGDPALVRLAQDCLAADPADRPRHAGDVADRIESYRRSLAARLKDAELSQATAAARAAARRARSRLAFVASTALLAAIGAGAWWWHSESLRRQARLAEESIVRDRVRQLVDAASSDPGGDPALWVRARDAARRGAFLGDLPKQIEQRLAAAWFDRRLIERLDEIRAHDGPSLVQLETQYAEAFSSLGIDIDRDDPIAVGARLVDRPRFVTQSFAAALDDWAVVRRDLLRTARGELQPWLLGLPDLISADPERWKRPLAAARVADGDQWRNHLRDAFEQSDGAALEELAASADPEVLPPYNLSLLGRMLWGLQNLSAAYRILSRAAAVYPNDYWLNSNLAELSYRLRISPNSEPVRFAMAAVALRPQSASAHVKLGMALFGGTAEDFSRAEREFRTAIRLRPQDYEAHFCLGWVLYDLGRHFGDPARFPEALAEYREALRIQPGEIAAHIFIAQVHLYEGRLDEAEQEFRTLLPIMPEDHHLREYLQTFEMLCDVEMRLGRGDQALAFARGVIEKMPDEADPHVWAGTALRSMDPLSPDAEAEFRAALDRNPRSVPALRGLGLLLSARGDAAGIDLVEKDLMAKFTNEARAAPGAGPDAKPVVEPAWTEAVAAARRQARLAQQPVDSRDSGPIPDCLDRARLCEDRQEYAAAARLLMRALASPTPPGSGTPHELYKRTALCCLRAGWGPTRDEPPLDESARGEFRSLALQWHKALLGTAAHEIENADPYTRMMAYQSLRVWQRVPEFAPLRDAAVLQSLSSEDQQAWSDFWKQIDDLLASATTPRAAASAP